MSSFLTRQFARSRPSSGVVRPRLGSLFEPSAIEISAAGTAVAAQPLTPSLGAASDVWPFEPPSSEMQAANAAVPAHPLTTSHSAGPAASTAAPHHQVNKPSEDPALAAESHVIPAALAEVARHSRTVLTGAPEVDGPLVGDSATAFPRQFEQTQRIHGSPTILPRTDEHDSDDPLPAPSPVVEDDSAGRSVERSRGSAPTARREAGAEVVPEGPPRTVVPNQRTPTVDSGESQHATPAVDSSQTQASRPRGATPENVIVAAAARAQAVQQSFSAAAPIEVEPGKPASEGHRETELARPLRSGHSVRADVMPGPPWGERTPRPHFRSIDPPTVRVTIGRIDVRAVMPPAPPAPTTRRVRPEPALSLKDYLQQRNGGQR